MTGEASFDGGVGKPGPAEWQTYQSEICVACLSFPKLFADKLVLVPFSIGEKLFVFELLLWLFRLVV